MEAPIPELDAACVSRVLSFVDDPAAFGAALRVCRLWRRCSRDATLPVWAQMDAARFRALHPGPDAPRFCACAVVFSLRHGAGRALRRLDVSAATACDACRVPQEEDGPTLARERPPVGSSPHVRGWRRRRLSEATCAAQEIARRACHVVNLFEELCFGRTPGGLPAVAAPHGCTLHRLCRAPVLEELDASYRGTPGDSLYGFGVFDFLFLFWRPAYVDLPRLRTLHLTHNPGITGDFLSRFLAHCPALRELYAAEVPLSEDFVRDVLAPRPLRLQLHRDAPLPRAVDITCGICGVALWRGLRQFAVAPPTQPHIDEEVYTSVPPAAEAVAPLIGANDRSLNCSRNCHGMCALLACVLRDCAHHNPRPVTLQRPATSIWWTRARARFRCTAGATPSPRATAGRACTTAAWRRAWLSSRQLSEDD